MSTFWDLLDWLLAIANASLEFATQFAGNNPVAAVLGLIAFLRLFGTTIPTGYMGVLFVFGRVRKELEPGFHPLLPVILAARRIPVRSITLDLPKQRLATADGLVYDVQANVVYRVVDPILAFTHVDSLSKGIQALLPLVLEQLLRDRTRSAVLEFQALEAEFSASAEKKLRRWGVAVEQAGFKTITPTKSTLRLTQLVVLADERHRVLLALVANGVPLRLAIPLLGAERCLVGHASARYRALHHHAHLAAVAADAPPIPQLSGEQPPGTSEIGGAPAPAEAVAVSPRPKKRATKGVEPRSWLRHKARLQRAFARTNKAVGTVE